MIGQFPLLRTCLAASLCCCITIWAHQTQASMFDLYGFGARGSAMANSLVADVDDGTASYYNPAALVRSRGVRGGFGLDGLVPDLRFQFEKEDPQGPAAMVPQGNLGFHGDLAVPLSSLTGDLGAPFTDRVTLGLGLFHGILRYTRIATYNPERPHFYLYDSLPDKLILTPAVGVSITPWFSVGAGLQVLAFVRGEVDVAVSLAEARFTERNLTMDIQGDASSTAGVLLGPFGDGVRIGFSYRDALSFSYLLPVNLYLEEVGLASFDIRGDVLFTPAHWTAGVSWYPAGGWFRVAGSLALARWSQAPDPSLHVTGTIGGETLGQDHPLLTIHSTPVDLGAQDVLMSALGLEASLSSRMVLRGGYSYRPTPLPTPIGRTNYVDCNTHTVGVGMGVLLGAGERNPEHHPLRVEGAAQMLVLANRHITKSDPEDPVGDFQVGGQAFHFTLTFSQSF